MAADRRVRGKQRKSKEDTEKPTKVEYAVAKYLRFNMPVKEGKLMGMTVQYFVASKAVDALMESKWSASKCKKDPLFVNRASCVDFCDILLQKGMYHRAARVERKKDRDKKKKKPGLEAEEKPLKEEKGKKEKKKKLKDEKKEEIDDKDQDKEEVSPEKDEKEEKETEKKEEKKDEEKKRRKKVKLEMHAQQMFKDGDEVYVWIYDPVHIKTFVIGLLLVLGAIGVCLFPLWPPEVRHGVYYLSLAAAGFVGFILALWVVRLILFCVIWCVTFGKHHFWFLPNLTEDVSFFDSFKPLYHHEIVIKSETSSKEEDNSDNKTEEAKETDRESEEKVEAESEMHLTGEEADRESGADSCSDDASRDNGYEFVEKQDIDGDDDDNDDDDEDEETEPKKTR